MPVPAEYQQATVAFERFLVDARDEAGLATTNQSYTMSQGVLQAFRRRLGVEQAILFANVLPPVLRAIFVADWNLDEPRREFEDEATMVKEVQALRPAHNWSPDTAIRDVATALRKHVDVREFDAVLDKLPPGAHAFWAAR
jgi:uncharacterized protein (DUF2267 family)